MTDHATVQPNRPRSGRWLRRPRPRGHHAESPPPMRRPARSGSSRLRRCPASPRRRTSTAPPTRCSTSSRASSRSSSATRPSRWERAASCSYLEARCTDLPVAGDEPGRILTAFVPGGQEAAFEEFSALAAGTRRRASRAGSPGDRPALRLRVCDSEVVVLDKRSGRPPHGRRPPGAVSATLEPGRPPDRHRSDRGGLT